MVTLDIGPPAAGLLVDSFQAPEVAMYMCGGLMMTSSVVICITLVLLKIKKRRENYIELWKNCHVYLLILKQQQPTTYDYVKLYIG